MTGLTSLEEVERAIESFRRGYLSCSAEVIDGIDQCDDVERIEADLLELLEMSHDWWEYLEDLPITEEVVAFGAGRSIYSAWRDRLAHATAEAFGCRLVSRKRLGGEPYSSQYWFVGYETGTRIASASYGRLTRACIRVGRNTRSLGEPVSMAVAAVASRVTIVLSWSVAEFGPWMPEEVDSVFGDVVKKLAIVDNP